MQGPSPDDPHPMKEFPQVGFLKPLVKNPNIVVGDYSYHDDPEGAEQFEATCFLYHFPFIGDKLVIGKFCALARGVRFIMNGANHQISGFSTYPFYIFGNGWESVTPLPAQLQAGTLSRQSGAFRKSGPNPTQASAPGGLPGAAGRSPSLAFGYGLNNGEALLAATAPSPSATG